MSSTGLIMSNPWKANSIGDITQNKSWENFMDMVAEVAYKELREDKTTREQCLEQFREWIKQNADIENCLMDDRFLLRFLRGKKFSIPMAQQVLLKYLNLRKKYKEMFYNLDYLDPDVYEVISNGYIFASPHRDRHGRRVILTLGHKFNPNKYKNSVMARAHLITYETILDDEENQVLGVTHFGDALDCGASFITLWPLKDFITLIRWGEQSIPMRHKEIHVINIPSAFKYVRDFCVSLLSPKLKERVFMYDSEEEMLKNLEPHLLPKEYGGIMPMDDMIEMWKKELAAKRDRLLSYDKMNLLSDRGIIRRRNKNLPNNDVNGVSGSFRKLEVD